VLREDVAMIRRFLRRSVLAFARWLFGEIRFEGEVKFGENTITVCPGGTNVIRWSGTQLALQAGDLGMSLASGRPQAWISGANHQIAHVDELPVVPTSTISSGSTSVGGGGGVVTLATVTPAAGQAFFPVVAIEYTGVIVGIPVSFGVNPTSATALGMEVWFETTGGGTNQLYFKCVNHNASSRTLRWAVIGYTY
jgi:hypothetical protein